MQTHRRAVLYLVLSSTLWSLAGILIKSIEWHPLAIAGCRSAIAAAVVYLLMPRPAFTFSPAQLGAAACYLGTVTLFVSATKLTTAANAIFLQYTAPIYIAVLGRWFLDEPPAVVDWVLIGVTLGGIGLFFVDDLSFTGFWGNVLALLSGLSFAGLAVLLRRQKEGNPTDSVLMGNVLTALVYAPLALGSRPNSGAWVYLILLGVFQLGISYVLFTKAIKHVRALEACLISTIEPVLNPLLVLWFIGETPQTWAIVGGVIVIAAATVRGVLTARGPVPLRPSSRSQAVGLER